ncbi:Barstar (barnase inhibitor) [Bacteroidales bacterium Barb7]|nr:Barstar (barnase inhibitor) [Bacteroidales bacterium Barb7]OAV76308.1 Barstar (barnase inhibitor) [Bacteroidales bacterium Barb7]
MYIFLTKAVCLTKLHPTIYIKYFFGNLLEDCEREKKLFSEYKRCVDKEIIEFLRKKYYMKTEEFDFTNDINEIENGNNLYVVKLNNNYTTEEELLNEYYSLLQFPLYFGFNWDALYDCLEDFHWIKQKNIIICHEILPQLKKNDLKIYLEILHDTVIHWRKYEEHNFNVYFNLKDYNTVQQVIG